MRSNKTFVRPLLHDCKFMKKIWFVQEGNPKTKKIKQLGVLHQREPFAKRYDLAKVPLIRLKSRGIPIAPKIKSIVVKIGQ